MKKEQRLQQTAVIFILSLFILSLLAACAGNSPEPASTSMQFNWVDTIEYAGFFAAEEEGYFEQENLDVDLRPGGFNADGERITAIDQVTSGAADFGNADAAALLKARAEGKPLVAVGTIYQRNPIGIAALSVKNINTPQDLIGKTVEIDLSGSVGVSYLAMLASQGIDPNDINTIPPTSYSIDSFTNGEADAVSVFITNRPVQLQLEGYDYDVILVSDYGIELYPNVIFTTEDMVENNPDVVERFLRAVARGTQSAIDEPAQAAEWAVARNGELSLEAETLSMSRSLPLISPANSQLLMMNPDVWEKTYQMLLDQGVLSQPIDLEEAYDTSFLEKALNQ